MQTGYQADFGPFDSKTWLNCAHQGPLPRVAAEEACEAVTWKVRPFELTAERFAEVPARRRARKGCSEHRGPQLGEDLPHLGQQVVAVGPLERVDAGAVPGLVPVVGREVLARQV